MSINILKCSQVPSLSSKSLQMLVSKCTQLRVLDLSYVALLNDIALRALTRCCQALVELDQKLRAGPIIRALGCCKKPG